MSSPDLELIQRSDAWFATVCGSLGGSRVGKALEVLKRSGERTKASEDLMFEIAAERLTGRARGWENAAKWGTDHEPQGKAQYATRTNYPVVDVGFIPHATIPDAHCSPDALVGLDGGLEVKCPTSATHLRTLVANAVPEEHLPQIHWCMACSGRLWWDFVSFDPRFRDPRLQYFEARVERDEEVIAKMESEVRTFLSELEDKLKALEARYPVEGA